MSWRLITKSAGNLRELRFLVPAVGGADQVGSGLRNFIVNQHKDLKMLNPSLNLPVREGFEDQTPTVIAQYGGGVEKVADVSGMDEAGVTDAVKKLVEASQFVKA